MSTPHATPESAASPLTAAPPVQGSRDANTAGDARLPWRRALALLWLGQVVSHLGDALFLGVIFFLALEVTGSRSASGLLIALNFTPALALGLFAGALVDRHDRRRVMIAADVLRGVAVGAIPVLHAAGHLNTAALGVAIFALATGTTVFNPAIKALIPELTPVAHLTTTVSIFQVAEYGALVLGPILGALAVPHLGSMHLLTLDAGTFLFSALCLVFLPRHARTLAHATRSRAAASAWQSLTALTGEVIAGVRAVLAVPVLRWLLLVVTLDNLAMMGLAHVATPLLVKESLGLGAGPYLSAQSFFFLGMTLASALFWLLGRNAPKGPTILLGIILDGLTFLPFAFCHSLAQVKLALFLHAFSIPLIIIPRTVLLQRAVPGPLHGRAFSLVNVTVFGMMAISSGVTGVLAETTRPQTLFLVMGTLGALTGLVGFAVPALRRAR